MCYEFVEMSALVKKKMKRKYIKIRKNKKKNVVQRENRKYLTKPLQNVGAHEYGRRKLPRPGCLSFWLPAWLPGWQLGWLNMSTLMSGIFYLMAQFRIKEAEYKATRTLPCTYTSIQCGTGYCAWKRTMYFLHTYKSICWDLYMYIWVGVCACVHSGGKCLWQCRSSAGHIYEPPPSMALCINF